MYQPIQFSMMWIVNKHMNDAYTIQTTEKTAQGRIERASSTLAHEQSSLD